jgi:glycerate 2-kinase
LVRSEDVPLTAPVPHPDLTSILDAALHAVSARAVIERAFAHWQPLALGRVSLLAVGKAASAMATAFVDVTPVRAGLVVGTHGGAPPPLVWHQSAHPVPDQRSVAAARAALALASTQQPDDVLVVLVSGGASALMALPDGALTLADKQQVTAQLLASGADIEALNCVRKHLSAIKGGRLAASCRGRVVAWLLSDVVGDAPSVIGSGLTVPDPTTFADALAVLDRCGGRAVFPSTVVAHLEQGTSGGRAETPKPGANMAHADTRVIGSAAAAVAAAAARARERGYEVIVRADPVVGEAREAAALHMEWLAGQTAGRTGPLCLLSCGETTVRVRGTGRGGRNQEFALACVTRLDAMRPRCALVASVGTDGVDGPTDAAGAWVDDTILLRARVHGLDPMAYLDANDSWHFFQRVGGLIRTGATDTNVGDLQIAIVPETGSGGV